MPFAGYPDFASCVAANQDKGDPEAFCACLHHEATGSYPTQKEVPMGALKKFFAAMAELVSEGAVGPTTPPEPVQKGDRIAIRKDVAIAKVAPAQQLVYGIVYEPNVADAHGDFMTAAQIEKSAHGFMVRYAKGFGDTGTEHARLLRRDQLPIVESYLAPVDFQLGEARVTKGTWVMVAKAEDPALWKAIQAGEYTGWSFEGMGSRLAPAA